LVTHHADSLLSVTLPADGSYFVHLGDIQQHGGAEYAYRLRIGPPRRDFELRIVPSSINVRGGGTVPLAVHALRRDGFSGDIDLAFGDAPRDFKLAGARIPAGQDQVRLTLTVPPARKKRMLTLSMIGWATIDSRQVTRPVVPAENMMQAFVYWHLVPVDELKAVVSPGSAMKTPITILSDLPVKIPAGGTAMLRISLPSGRGSDKLHLELDDPPDGIAIESESRAGHGMEVVLKCDAAKVKAGLKGNLIVNAFAIKSEKTPQRRTRPTPLGMLPAIPFEIVAAD
ncbi:MAG: hypothetical protein ACYSWQ_07980, partial [Planctomycetota bacterium]